MKKLFLFLLITAASIISAQETVKSKPLKLKYTPPSGWVAEEFGSKLNWEETGNALCKCSGVKFTKQHNSP